MAKQKQKPWAARIIKFNEREWSWQVESRTDTFMSTCSDNSVITRKKALQQLNEYLLAHGIAGATEIEG